MTQENNATLPKDQPTADHTSDRAVKSPSVTETETTTLPSSDEAIISQTGTSPSSPSAAAEAGRVREGPAVAAQSIHDKQQNFYQVAGEVARKPVGEITREDAAEVTRAETRLLGEPPGKGRSSAAVQSIVDHNARKKNQ